MKTRFTVAITEVGQEPQFIGKDWKMGAGNTSEEYGYTPEVEATCDYTREIYRQTVDEIDLADIIKAVNDI